MLHVFKTDISKVNCNTFCQ